MVRAKRVLPITFKPNLYNKQGCLKNLLYLRIYKKLVISFQVSDSIELKFIILQDILILIQATATHRLENQ